MSLTNKEADDLLYFQGCPAINLEVLSAIDALGVDRNLKSDVIQYFQTLDIRPEDALIVIRCMQRMLDKFCPKGSSVMIFNTNA